MRIWIVNHYAIPATEVGGTRHFSLARDLVRRGHDVTIFASAFLHIDRSRADAELRDAPLLRREVVDGVKFVWIRTPPYRGNGVKRIGNMVSFAASMWRIGVAEDDRPDVIIGSSPHPFAAYAALRCSRRFGVPFVLEVRDLWPDSLVTVTGVSPFHPFIIALRWLERHLYRTAARVVSLMANSVDHIVSHGAQRDGVVWIPNGVDFSIAPPATRRASGKPFTVTYAGSMGQVNALESVIDAARLLRSAQPPILFRMVGDGPERDRLREIAETHDLTNVTFVDPVPKHQVYALLDDSDVLIATTRNIDLYARGLSFNKLFDYLAAGRPVVFGANCPGNPVEDAEAGEIVPPEDSAAMASAIQRLAARSPDERWEIGRRGRAFVEDQYDMHRLADRLEQTLLAAVASQRGESVSTLHRPVHD